VSNSAWCFRSKKTKPNRRPEDQEDLLTTGSSELVRGQTRLWLAVRVAVVSGFSRTMIAAMGHVSRALAVLRFSGGRDTHIGSAGL
jgi:hypothetical protein